MYKYKQAACTKKHFDKQAALKPKQHIRRIFFYLIKQILYKFD